MSQLKSAVISGKMSTQASFIMGNKSVFQPTGHAATTPVYLDETLRIQTANGVVNPPLASKISYNLPKNSTLVYKGWHEFTLAPGTTQIAAGPVMSVANLYPAVPSTWVPPVAGVWGPGSLWPQAEYVVSSFICELQACILGQDRKRILPHVDNVFAGD